ncbi:MAG: hypothetical protein WBL19_03350 [Minisyncoccia bacterium]
MIIPSSFWWWVVGVPVALGVIVIFWKKRKSLTALGQVRKKISFWPVFWSAVVVVIVLLNVFDDEIEDEARTYLADKSIGGLPILARSDPVSPEATLAIICETESPEGHRDDNGDVITNKNTDGTIDIGKCQINSQHEERAKSEGYDIWTEEGNEAFAKVLFDESGTTPWNASRDRWGDKVTAPYAETFSGTTIATGTVRVGQEWSDWVRVPPGQELFFERMDNTSFEVELQGGEIFEFQRNFAGHKRFPLIQRIRFRVTDEEAEELLIWLRFSPF